MKRMIIVAVAAVASYCSHAALSAKSYVREGLIAHWDGEQNVSYAAPHDGAATVWRDLTGNGQDFSVPSDASFCDKGLTTTRLNGGVAAKWDPVMTAFTNTKYTIEIALDNKTPDPEEKVGTNPYPDDHLFKLLMLGAEEYFVGLQGSTQVGFQPNFEGWKKGFSRCMEVDSNRGQLTLGYYQNGTGYGMYGSGKTWSNGIAKVPTSFVSLSGGLRINKTNATGYGIDGVYHDIRIYDRSLTADERLINKSVDAVRFFGVPADQCDLPEGWRFVTSSGETALERLTLATISLSGAGRITVNGSAAAEEVMYWAEVDEAHSVELTAVANPGYEFASWKGVLEDKDRTNPSGTFTAIGPIVAVFRKVGSQKLSSISYIQNGLIAQWDGEENVGRGLHDAAATQWKSLVGDLAIAMPGGAVFTANGVQTGRSKGSKVSGADVGVMEETVTNTHYSVEIAFNKTAPTTKSPDGYQNYMCNMFVLRNMYFPVGTQTEEGALERMGFSPNGSNGGGGSIGEIVTFVNPTTTMGHHTLLCSHEDGVATVRADGELVKQVELTPKKINLASNQYFWFNRGWYENVGLEGVYYAIRYYNRALTEDETKINLAVDQVRFFGADPLTTELPEGWRFNTSDGISLEQEVAISVRGEGTVSAGTVWVVNNVETAVNLTATPSPDWRFKRWLGAVNPGDAKTATGAIRISGPVVAEFVPVRGICVIVR